ncbi:5,6-dimethylbenzimidazole synthase [Ketobacter sp. MCCC 1A13808]|uniref:5,6-dimethylbenzimidazole synthase n=1 Tax=Ketobacter sp. MCCC 1A13808 TaxID=2602738 RepID=UPI0012EB78CC|nr:5,6-dimethylbenzimidazole synthase [Ketobacter sp. MCCC 1A13808]MVF12855.1 5,6-dimethylbenzimidazole synthase [Ketobacter sp. MCCC 1A13808]
MKGRHFTPQDAELLEAILQNRRDIRGNRFHSKPISDPDLERILLAGIHAPSVGFSQPWEFVLVTDRQTRQKVKNSFDSENSKASEHFSGERQSNYQELKLEGILESPLNIAVFYRPSGGAVLGQTAMEEVGRYSVVCAIQNMWLMSRSLNIGMGWVSILNPDAVREILSVPQDRELVGYLCLGYVDEFYSQPELERLQWEKRKSLQSVVYSEQFPSSP